MTKLILKIGIAALAVAFQANAAEVGPPYDQLEVDRALPSIDESEFERLDSGKAVPQFPERDRMERTAPYDPLEVDRAVPDVSDPVIDEGASAGASSGKSVWDSDYHFIAPAQ